RSESEMVRFKNNSKSFVRSEIKTLNSREQELREKTVSFLENSLKERLRWLVEVRELLLSLPEDVQRKRKKLRSLRQDGKLSFPLENGKQ
ncbi:MAG: hypothetical protein ABEJ65_06515, partial [bacterium]